MAMEADEGDGKNISVRNRASGVLLDEDEVLGHEADDVRLRDRLPFPDGQRVRFIRLRAERRRNKEVPRDVPQRSQDARIGDPFALDLIAHHRRPLLKDGSSDANAGWSAADRMAAAIVTRRRKPISLHGSDVERMASEGMAISMSSASPKAPELTPYVRCKQYQLYGFCIVDLPKHTRPGPGAPSRGWSGRGGGLRGKPLTGPGLEPSQQDAHVVVPLLDHMPRQTGAGGLAGSGAVEDKLAVAGEFVHMFLERRWTDPSGPW